MRKLHIGALGLSLSLVVGGCTAALGEEGEGGSGDGSPSGNTAGADGAGLGPDGQPLGDFDPADTDTLLRNPTADEVEAAAGDSSVCLPGIPGTTQMPRLSRVQYDNTVRDLLHVEVAPSSLLAPESGGSVDQRAWDGYKQAAATVAEAVMGDANARAQVITCTPEGDGDACLSQLVQDLGRRAFRRPLTPGDTARFDALLARRAEITPNNTFDEVAQLVIEAFLLSPSFIVRAEITEQPDGEFFALDGYEVANRLSYLLWNSMPDEALVAAAAAGELAAAEGIFAQAQRMLSDPKARDMVRDFHEHYMHMGPGTRWEEINRDPALYPAYDPSMSDALSEETLRFVDHVVFGLQGSFQTLVLEPTGFVNSALAPLYGLEPAAYGPELTAAPLDPNQRAGIFTRLGFLASHSYYDRSSPIHRGAFIQKEVLCAPIGTPPPGAEGQPLPTEGLNTNRDRVDAQTAAPACATCHHTSINPTGFAFENYDAVGAWQVTENFSGAAIDSSSTAPIGYAGAGSITMAEVAGPVAMSEAIANAPDAHTCYARRWVEYAFDRAINNQDSCIVENLEDKLTDSGYSILNLIADLTQSGQFRFRALQEEDNQ